jgi:concanavalin A-like lectin/glucanase superfamily protein
VLGWDTTRLARDFVAQKPIDASTDVKGVTAADVVAPGTKVAQIDFDGATEALANFTAQPYGVANSWTVAAWLRPSKLAAKGGARFAFDLNATANLASASRISLSIDAAGHFTVLISDSAGSERSISSSTTVDASALGTAWYHVVAVKNGASSLALYVNGALVASTNVGVPAQTDVARVVRVGARAKSGTGDFWAGGIGSIAVWRSALGASEISALAGDRGKDPR